MLSRYIIMIAILCSVVYSEISRKQWTNINRLLLRNPVLPSTARTVLDTNIYKKYHNWAKKYAIKYSEKHPHKCKFLAVEDLNRLAENGLWDAIYQYYPETIHTDFCIFAIGYIKSQISCECHNLQSGCKI